MPSKNTLSFIYGCSWSVDSFYFDLNSETTKEFFDCLLGVFKGIIEKAVRASKVCEKL